MNTIKRNGRCLLLKNQALKKYARLIVKIGINIRPNQTLVISSPVDCVDFARMIAEIAYEEGAREVVMNWHDEIISKTRFLHAPDEIFRRIPQWKRIFICPSKESCISYYIRLGSRINRRTLTQNG